MPDFERYETPALLTAIERCIEKMLDIAYENGKHHRRGGRVVNITTGEDVFTAFGDEFSAAVKELRKRLAG